MSSAVENLFELLTEAGAAVGGPAQLRPVAWTSDETLCGSFLLSITAQSRRSRSATQSPPSSLASAPRSSRTDRRRSYDAG